MTMIKKGTCSSSVVLASTVHACEKCGHVQMMCNDDGELKECPKCSSRMKMLSASVESSEVWETSSSSSSE